MSVFVRQLPLYFHYDVTNRKCPPQRVVFPLLLRSLKQQLCKYLAFKTLTLKADKPDKLKVENG